MNHKAQGKWLLYLLCWLSVAGWWCGVWVHGMSARMLLVGVCFFAAPMSAMLVLGLGALEREGK